MLTFRATHTQAWYFHASMTGWSEISVPTVLRVSGPVCRATLAGALTELIDRHESLRTTLHQRDDGVVQRIHSAGALQLPEPQLPSSVHSGRDVLAEEIAAPFLVRGGPLARFKLIRLSVDEHLLVINLHHSVCDGMSGALLHRDLSELYRARQEGRPAELPSIPIHMGDYATWEGRAQHQDVGAYWREQLSAGHPRLQVGRGSAWEAEPARLTVRSLPVIAADTAVRLEGLGSTLSRVLGAAVTAAVATYAEDEITVRVVTANRHRPELQDVVGNLAEWLPVRVALTGDPTFAEFAARYDGAVADAYDHLFPSAGLFRLIRENPQRRTGPLFDLEVNYLDMRGHDGGGGADGVHFAVDDEPWSELWRPVVDRWQDDLPVMSFLHERQRDGSVAGQLLVNETMIGRDAALDLARRVEVVIGAISETPALRLSELADIGISAR